jgi:hypothetical protein
MAEDTSSAGARRRLAQEAMEKFILGKKLNRADRCGTAQKKRPPAYVRRQVV